MRLLIMGPPGAGKGTQAALIKSHYAIPHISTGDMFRSAIAGGTPLGSVARHFLDAGELVPDAITIGIVRQRLHSSECAGGFLLDGFPRTISQAEALDLILAEAETALDAVINISVDDATLIRRVSGRRLCRNCGASYHIENIPPKVEGVCDVCGGELYQRPDDTPETLANRLVVYYRQTKPLLKYYEKRGLVHQVPGAGRYEETWEAVKAILGRRA